MTFEIKNVSFCYAEKKVIDNLSINLEAGRFYGILGPNGSGKTTLLDLLINFRQPSSGAIFYKGKELPKFSRKELSREISLVPQNFYINFPFTAKEIVMMGRYPHIPRFSPPSLLDLRIVGEIMEKTFSLEFEDRFITELSGGERQRVVFARSLAQDTPVLMLDEATSNLDITHTISLLNIAARKVEDQKATVIAILHDINLAALFCHDLLFMKQGRIAAYGTVDNILTEDNIKTVFNADAKVYYEPYSKSKQVIFKR